jgi:hypothetical protein
MVIDEIFPQRIAGFDQVNAVIRVTAVDFAVA